MSGAKAIWKGVNEKYTGDDGILLSEEVENLDFSKLNLVVLSACGTGLGNPTNDGVYGLQRAFKKAGAQTIIMSLWNVDDNATALMMETFYQELVKTNSKHQAFRKAQEAVREKYETPYYYYNTSLLNETIDEVLRLSKLHNLKIHFSLKSNFNEKIVRLFASHEELGADCVSGGEVNYALKFFPADKIVFAGIGKTDKEIEKAVDAGIFCLNVESYEELENLNEICKKKKKENEFRHQN